MIFWTGRLYDHHFVSQVAPQRIGGTLGAVPQTLVICLFFLGDETTQLCDDYNKLLNIRIPVK